MSDWRNKIEKIKRPYLQIVGILLLLFLAVALLQDNLQNSTQASGSVPALVDFDGEYRIADGEWQPIEKGAHIPTTKGDVTLRINFHLTDPDGNPWPTLPTSAPIAFYMDHIGLTFYVDGVKVRTTDNEHPQIGESACGVTWTMHTIGIGIGKPIEIVVHNPHSFGNETAIDEMLASFAVWGNIEFEKDILSLGETQRNTGILLILASVVFLGIALFSSLIHIKNSKIIWLLGLVVLFAGIYLAYSAYGVSFWSESVISNTTVHVLSMIFYTLFISALVVNFLHVTQKIGNFIVLLLGAADAVFILLPILTDIFFYDVLGWWVLIQLAANASLVVCLIREIVAQKSRTRRFYIVGILPMLSFAADALGTAEGFWKGGLISQYVFIVLFAVAMIMVLRLIPRSINAATKARELEMEKITLNSQLAESRISTMMSQIRPHFIYNTLGSIEQLCKLDPPKAGELVHNFAKYLRGNFGELDNPKPILMSQEMEHVHHYISIENVRFPDMTFTFEMDSEDFCIPALTIQPIVENAIKHGLMKLSEGGTIRVVSYETETDYCISVVDDGAGFDVNELQDDRKHVGLRNIRERLKVMVNGTLEIESTVGVGTKVLITIPKRGNKK